MKRKIFFLTVLITFVVASTNCIDYNLLKKKEELLLENEIKSAEDIRRLMNIFASAEGVVDIHLEKLGEIVTALGFDQENPENLAYLDQESLRMMLQGLIRGVRFTLEQMIGILPSVGLVLKRNDFTSVPLVDLINWTRDFGNSENSKNWSSSSKLAWSYLFYDAKEMWGKDHVLDPLQGLCFYSLIYSLRWSGQAATGTTFPFADLAKDMVSTIPPMDRMTLIGFGDGFNLSQVLHSLVENIDDYGVFASGMYRKQELTLDNVLFIAPIDGTEISTAAGNPTFVLKDLIGKTASAKDLKSLFDALEKTGDTSPRHTKEIQDLVKVALLYNEVSGTSRLTADLLVAAEAMGMVLETESGTTLTKAVLSGEHVDMADLYERFLFLYLLLSYDGRTMMTGEEFLELLTAMRAVKADDSVVTGSEDTLLAYLFGVVNPGGDIDRVDPLQLLALYVLFSTLAEDEDGAQEQTLFLTGNPHALNPKRLRGFLLKSLKKPLYLAAYHHSPVGLQGVLKGIIDLLIGDTPVEESVFKGDNVAMGFYSPDTGSVAFASSMAQQGVPSGLENALTNAIENDELWQPGEVMAWAEEQDLAPDDLDLILAQHGNQRGIALVLGEDNDLILGGDTDRGDYGGWDILMKRLNPDWHELWVRTYGIGSHDYLEDMLSRDGRIFALARTSSTGGGGADFWYLEIDRDGTTLRDDVWGDDTKEYPDSLASLIDNSVVTVGRMQTGKSDPYSLLIWKHDGKGSEEWRKTFGGVEGNRQVQVVPLDDGTLLVGSTTTLDSESEGKVAVARFGVDGDMLWHKTFGGSGTHWLSELVALRNGDALIVGNEKVFSQLTNGWLVRIDSDGKVVWARTVASEENEIARSAVESSEGGFVIALETRLGEGAADILLRVISPDSTPGNILRYDSGGADSLGQVIQSARNEFIVLGTTDVNGNEDMFLIRRYLAAE